MTKAKAIVDDESLVVSERLSLSVKIVLRRGSAVTVGLERCPVFLVATFNIKGVVIVDLASYYVGREGESLKDLPIAVLERFFARSRSLTFGSKSQQGEMVFFITMH